MLYVNLLKKMYKMGLLEGNGVPVLCIGRKVLKVCCVLLSVFCVMFVCKCVLLPPGVNHMCTVLLPPGVNPTAVK
jgi:hypothetical protein